MSLVFSVFIFYRLGRKGCTDLFNALARNITLKELIINGNGFGDKSIPSLIQFLKNPDNALEVLSISHNNISAEGMCDLSLILGSHRHLLELYLDGNPIQSTGVEFLFTSIWRSQIKFISLSNCGITSCGWASPMIYMTNLESLSLSYNQIDGTSLQNLCEALQRCACIRHLNLSYNHLQTIQAGCVGQLIKVHKGLISLDLSGNLLPSEVVAAIVLGIYGNCTLRTLNLTWCNLTEHQSSLLCTALAENSLLDLNLNFNPIPDDMKLDPRRSAVYLARRSVIESNRHSLEVDGFNRLDSDNLIRAVLRSSVASTSSSGAVAEEEKHLEFAFIDCLSAEIASELWRQQRLIEINLAKQAYEDVSKLRHDSSDDLNFGASSFVSENLNQDFELKLHIDPGSAAEKARKHFISAQSALIDVLDGKLILSVSYGRRNEVIGSIEVSEKMTYSETRQLIHPLLESYFQSSERRVLERASNFKMLDGLGFVLSEEAEKVSLVVY